MQIVSIPTEALVPFARNSRTHSPEQVDQIARSITEFGFTNPVLIGADNDIIAGHGRVLAARKLGLAEVPCIRLGHLTDSQKRAYVIADNQLALNSGWDEEMLKRELADLRALDFDLSLVGFSDGDLSSMLADATASGNTDPDDVPEAPADTISILGDIWHLGSHRIVCGDCTDPATVDKALAGSKPHLMVTDPPYGVKYDPAWRTKAGVGSAGAATGKVLNDDRADWRAAWALFPGSVVYVWHGGLHAGVVEQSLAACKFGIRAQIVWVKTRPALSRGHYHWQHEPTLYGVKEGEEDQWRFVPEHEVSAYACKDGSTASWAGGRKQSTVWFIEHIKSDTGHGTQKPVDCMKRPIENNSAPGQPVYEPFSGSGTTIIAGEMTGRPVHAIELNPAYVDVAVLRWQAFTGRQAIHAETGKTFDEIKAERAAKEVAK